MMHPDFSTIDITLIKNVGNNRFSPFFLIIALGLYVQFHKCLLGILNAIKLIKIKFLSREIMFIDNKGSRKEGKYLSLFYQRCN